MSSDNVQLLIDELANLFDWPLNGTLIIAISGGPDSTCAMRLMHEVALLKGFNLHFAHLDHCLRGNESTKDAIFVEQLAIQFNWGYTVEKANIKSVHSAEGGSIQQICRLVRQEFLTRVANKTEAFGIAFGHNKGDQAETILQHLMRGSGLAGLTGMRMLDISSKLFVTVRPILKKTRSEIIEILKHYYMSYRQDASNETDKYQRNHIRRNLIPYIEEHYNPQIISRLADMSDILRADEDFIEKEARKLADRAIEKQEKAVVIDCNVLKDTQQALGVRIMRYAYHLLNGSTENLTFEHSLKLYKLINSSHGNSISLPCGINCEKIYHQLYFYHQYVWEKSSQKYPSQIIELNSEIHICSNKKLNISLEDYDRTREYFKNKLKEVYFDYSEVTFPLSIRSRENGDRFYPDGAPGSKKLKDFFIDKKIPKNLRDKCVLLVDNSGKILWVVGIRRSQFAKISDKTEKILACRIMEGE